MSNSQMALACLSRHTKKCLITNNQDWEKNLKSFILKDKIDYLIPIGYQSVMKCSKARDKLKKIVKLTLPSVKSLSIAADKSLLMKFAEKNGFAHPKTIAISNQSGALRAARILGYPLVVKPCLEGLRPSYPENQKELTEVLACLLPFGPKLLAQEYIKGDGYGYFALCDRGKPKLVFMHRRLRELPPTGGASTCAESVHDKKLAHLGSKILSKLNWTGVAMVEFKKYRGQYYLIEVNPKFWGSLELSLASGVDFLSGLIKLVDGKRIPKADYPAGVKFQWPFPYDFRRSLKKPVDFWSFLLDLFNPKVKKDFWLIDPLPSIKQLLAAFFKV